MQFSHIELKLLCVLTDDEIRTRGRILGETVSQIDVVQGERTEAARAFKEQLTGLAEQQRELARVIRDRAELRIVACVVKFHEPLEGRKRIIRLDTGEIVRDEEMSDAEKQLHLFSPAELAAAAGVAPAAVEPTEQIAGDPA